MCKILEEDKNKEHKWEIFDESICQIHSLNYEFICTTCNKNLCFICIESGKHEKHSIFNFSDIKLTLQEINDVKELLMSKEIFIERITEKIKLWKENIIRDNYIDIFSSDYSLENLLYNGIERLIKYLIQEFSFLSKIYDNYNYNEIKINYHKNMKIIYDYLKNKKNNYLEDFMKSNDFFDQTQLLLKACSCIGKKEKDKDDDVKIIEFIQFKDIDQLLIEKINDNYSIIANTNSLFLACLENGKMKIVNNISLASTIYSISISPDDDRIYVCLLDPFKVKIIKYYLSDNDMKIKKYIIFDDSNERFPIEKYFTKCIKLSNNYLVTSDFSKIRIWELKKGIENCKIVKEIKLNTLTSDILNVNDNYFISSQPNINSLTLIDSENYKVIKRINNIMGICDKKYYHCFFKYKNEYIIINCIKEIGLFFIETKELVQRIQIENQIIKYQNFTYDGNKYLYIISQGNKILMYKLVDGSINYIKEITIPIKRENTIPNIYNIFPYLISSQNIKCLILYIDEKDK